MQMARALSHSAEVKRTFASNESVGNEISERRIELEIERQMAGRTSTCTNDEIHVCQRWYPSSDLSLLYNTYDQVQNKQASHLFI